MGLFGFKKRRKDVIDLTEKYEKQKEREERIKSSINENQNISQESSTSSVTPFPFFDNPGRTSEESLDLSQNTEDKRKKFAKRISDMTDRIEDLSNQIYHLQQRIEVLERKSERGY